MTDYERGFEAAKEAAAGVASNYYTGVIRCKHQDKPEHVRMHVEYQWSAEVAKRIRALRHDPL